MERRSRLEVRVRRSVILYCLAGALIAGYAWQASDAQEPPPPTAAGTPKNVILLIGDGMGPQQLALLFDWSDAAGHGETALQRFANDGTLGLLRTPAFDSPVTDSAAAATALASGVRTANGFIGMDPKSQSVPTCLEDAKATGRATGLVTSTRITHATPACFAAHVPNRGMEPQIGYQLFTGGKVDLLLGGGARVLDAAGRNPDGTPGKSLRQLTEESGCDVTTDWTAVSGRTTLPEGKRLLGLFADSHLPYRIDRDEPGEETSPTLTELTSKALEMLKARGGDKGFFLMVEGGRIDHAGHANDVAGVLGEMREFDETVAAVRAFQDANPGTLVVITADHETGGLCITYGKRATTAAMIADIGNAKATIGRDPDVKPPEVTSERDFGFGRGGFHPNPGYWKGNAAALERSARWNVSYGSGGHSTTPVTVFARGPGAARFAGLHDNTHVGRVLREYLQK